MLSSSLLVRHVLCESAGTTGNLEENSVQRASNSLPYVQPWAPCVTRGGPENPTSVWSGLLLPLLVRLQVQTPTGTGGSSHMCVDGLAVFRRSIGGAAGASQLAVCHHLRRRSR